jgi:predicted lipoprotein with Yx(FWY)xxD motif
VNRSTYIFALLAVTATALFIAGCGGSGDSTGGGSAGAYGGGASGGGESTAAGSEEGGSSAGAYAAPAPESSTETAAGTAVVSLASVPKLGMILVDSRGFALYDFHKDKGATPSCYGACAEAWPPLLSKGPPQAGNGAKASLLGTADRKDGTTQVTYAGHPLYGFVGDKKPGEANGNDVSAFGAEWYALMGNGEEPED